MSYLLDQANTLELARLGFEFPVPPTEPIQHKENGVYLCYECGNKRFPKKFKNLGAYNRHIAKTH